MPGKPYNKYQAQFYGVRPCINGRPSSIKLSAQIEAARHRLALATPRDLTGLLMGDPPRGFSALERGAAKPDSIRHDSLDDLIFGVIR